MDKLLSGLSLYALHSNVYNKLACLVTMCSFPFYTNDNTSWQKPEIMHIGNCHAN